MCRCETKPNTWPGTPKHHEKLNPSEINMPKDLFDLGHPPQGVRPRGGEVSTIRRCDGGATRRRGGDGSDGNSAWGCANSNLGSGGRTQGVEGSGAGGQGILLVFADVNGHELYLVQPIVAVVCRCCVRVLDCRGFPGTDLRYPSFA
jgi:hypothetical protein